MHTWKEKTQTGSFEKSINFILKRRKLKSEEKNNPTLSYSLDFNDSFDKSCFDTVECQSSFLCFRKGPRLRVFAFLNYPTPSSFIHLSRPINRSIFCICLSCSFSRKPGKEERKENKKKKGSSFHRLKRKGGKKGIRID